MAPNFFTKLVKTSNSGRDGTRSPSPSQSSPPPRQPTISISRPSSSHRPSNSLSSNRRFDSDSDSINPNVTVIPPSPRTSNMSVSDGASTPGSQRSTDDLKGPGNKPSRRLHSLSLSSHPHSPHSPDDDVVTPTPSRPEISGRSSTIRPLSHSSSTGNLREQAKNGQPIYPVSAAVSSNNNMQRQQELSRTPSMQSMNSNKSNRSGLRIDLKANESVQHNRSATAPAESSPPMASEDGSIVMSPIVESPTRISPGRAIHDVAIEKTTHTLTTSATLPNIPNSALLAAPDNSDAASVYSVNSTTKKRRIFRRLSMKEPSSPASSGSPSSQTKSPKRKNTGLAGAIAASGLAMANPMMSMPSPAEMLAHEQRSNTMGSIAQRSRTSVDRTRSPVRSRQQSISYAASDYSDADSFISGAGGGSDDEDDLDLDAVDFPITGFAVASARRNIEFHEQFPSVPEGDYLIEDYGCALQREILIQGRIYISENHLCFHANIFGWVTDLTIPMYDVTALDKRMTAFVIPNAIQITTRNAKYTFTSFLSRDTTYDVIYNVWRSASPESQRGSPRQSLETGDSGENIEAAETTAGAVAVANGKSEPKVSKVTQCACGKAGEHFSETAMEVVLPGTPEKIYNLMFTSGFIKDFMRDGQRLTDIQISDWMPLPTNATLLARNMSYIKPLTNSIGPKQTKCELRDEMSYCNFDDYVSMVTTTRTPDVPSGNVFSVKTRTCIMWASTVSTRVIVSTQVEWTGRSFIKGIIERSALEGQRTYHVDLEKAMREYILAHQSEFVPEGVDPNVVEETEVQIEAETPKTPLAPAEISEEKARKVRGIERNQRGLQWAYDTFEGTMKVAKQSTEGALELIKDAWDSSSGTTIAGIFIALLLITNIYSIVAMGKREEIGRRKEMRRTEEREKWVQGIVTALWDELAATKAASGGWPPSVRIGATGGGDVKAEIADINLILDQIEERVRTLRRSLQELD